ncbi:hypothetical protein OPQ81_006378 [Rhizoctonia solani]|nr:hypothetical protein OPQ81_006378 [Rhizoctonia solani]
MDVAISCVRTVLTISERAVCLVTYVVVGVACVMLAYAGPPLFKFFVVNPYKSHIKYLPGPKPRGIFVSDCDFILGATRCKEYNERFAREYGLNIRIQGMGYMEQRLVTYDPTTISYILGSAADRFPKPVQMRRLIAKLTGGNMSLKAITVVEGTYHHRLRKIVAPAFAPSTVRGHAPIFIRKANELCDHWRSILSEPIAPAVPGVETDLKGNTVLDVNNWFGRLAFDVIGLAAFGYSFDSLRDDSNELFSAYMRLHRVTYPGPNIRTNICLSWPQLEPFLRDQNSKVINESAQIVRETSKTILNEMRNANPEGDGKSILGLLLRSNAAAAPEDRLTDEELLAQIDSFMFIGSETSGLSIMWALYELTRNPDIQQALRTELLPLGLSQRMSEQAISSDPGINLDVTVSDHTTQFAAIDALPLLDRVVRESLRLHPPVQGTLRIAEQDDIVPFSAPPKMPDGSISPAVVTGLGADGVQRTGIRVRKGDFIHLPFEPMNSIRDMWGEDGHKFNPDRWLDLSAAAKSNPGVIPGLATFSVGPHSCPAFLFAMAEMKTMLAYAVSSFAFEETHNIVPYNMMVTRPFVKNQLRQGFRLPLCARPL